MAIDPHASHLALEREAGSVGEGGPAGGLAAANEHEVDVLRLQEPGVRGRMGQVPAGQVGEPHRRARIVGRRNGAIPSRMSARPVSAWNAPLLVTVGRIRALQGVAIRAAAM